MCDDNTAFIVEQIKDEFNYQIDNFNKDELNKLACIIRDAQSNIHFCGIGKSGNISSHCCDLLKSISIPAFNLDALNLTHGDFGALKKDDVVIFFSASGGTKELLDVASILRQQGIMTVSICCKDDTKLAAVCDVNITTPFREEIGGNIDKIPTNSIMSQLLFVNILTSILKASIDIDQYKINHTSGSIGKNLLKIRDLLITENYPIINIGHEKEVDIYNVMLQMTACKLGCCCFVDDANELIGILTGGDCRRLLLKNKLKITVDYLNIDYYHESDVNLFLCDIQKLHVKYIPVVENRLLVGIIDTANVINQIN
jgi:arabinose-5-phosphate isomerase